MRKATFKYIESELFHLEDTKKEIKILEYDAMFVRENEDENVGGGKSNIVSSPIESIILKLGENIEYQYRVKIVICIQSVYDQLDDLHKKLVQLRYWSKENLTWPGIAQRLNVSERKALYMRKYIIEEIAKKLGV